MEWRSGRAKLRLSRFSLKAAILQEKSLARRARERAWWSGAPGVGKSRASVALAQAGATKERWFDLEVHHQFKTMILQSENGKHRLKTEISDIEPCTENCVRISSPPQYGFQFDNQEFRQQLSEEINDFQPDVFLIDPWNAVARRTTQEDYLEADNAFSTVPRGRGLSNISTQVLRAWLRNAPCIVTRHLRKTSSYKCRATSR
jgi:hypothetical protein